MLDAYLFRFLMIDRIQNVYVEIAFLRMTTGDGRIDIEKKFEEKQSKNESQSEFDFKNPIQSHGEQ